MICRGRPLYITAKYTTQGGGGGVQHPRQTGFGLENMNSILSLKRVFEFCICATSAAILHKLFCFWEASRETEATLYVRLEVISQTGTLDPSPRHNPVPLLSLPQPQGYRSTEVIAAHRTTALILGTDYQIGAVAAMVAHKLVTFPVELDIQQQLCKVVIAFVVFKAA